MKARIRRKGQAKGPGLPSLFFLIALTLGILLLVWIVASVVTKPATPPAHRTSSPPISATSAPA